MAAMPPRTSISSPHHFSLYSRFLPMPSSRRLPVRTPPVSAPEVLHVVR
jgi:hypothetical protein